MSTDVLSRKVTGLKDGKRTYDSPLLEKGKWDFEKLVQKASQITGYARVFYELQGKSEGKYDVIIRSINSIDARTATVTNLPFELITELKEKILQIPETKNVYLDITPKPPATIEYV